YSPHLFYVQRGGTVSPKDFAKYLAHELANLEKRYPRRNLTLEETTSIANWRHQEELSSLSNPNKEIYQDGAGSWTVLYDDQVQFTPSCLNRAIKVIAMDQPEQLIPMIAPYRTYLQTVGVATSPKELFHIANIFSQAGVTRVTSIGKMTS